MISDCKVITFVATAQPERARAFYEDTLGLRLVADDSFAIVFDANGTMLRVQKVQSLVAAPFTVLGWSVADIAAEVAALTGKGVVFERFEFMQQDDLGVWTSPSGAKVAWFKDPDGNTLSLTEL
jgi:catechol 2,3-dioxygenase-like lactoylglutathione lyase family enzyme